MCALNRVEIRVSNIGLIHTYTRGEVSRRHDVRV